MIRINLLPFRAARKKENIRRQISIFSLSLVLILLALFLINSLLAGKINALNEQIRQTKSEIEKYAKINDEIQRIKSEIAILKKKIKVIKDLEANRTEPVKLLDAMTGLVVPNRMWFTDFESMGPNVHITGIALDNQTVADFMVRLENSNLFDVVNLNTLKHVKYQQIDMKSYHITCNKAISK
ncbi:MAG: PilN domain-containing protein [Desulfobacterales bacterium]